MSLLLLICYFSLCLSIPCPVLYASQCPYNQLSEVELAPKASLYPLIRLAFSQMVLSGSQLLARPVIEALVQNHCYFQTNCYLPCLSTPCHVPSVPIFPYNKPSEVGLFCQSASMILQPNSHSCFCYLLPVSSLLPYALATNLQQFRSCTFPSPRTWPLVC